jgi:hypothetical protein
VANAASACLMSAAMTSASIICSSDLFLDCRRVFLRGFDFVLDGLIFAVGLDWTESCLELTDASLNTAASFSSARRASWLSLRRCFAASTLLRVAQTRVGSARR